MSFNVFYCDPDTFIMECVVTTGIEVVGNRYELRTVVCYLSLTRVTVL